MRLVALVALVFVVFAGTAFTACSTASGCGELNTLEDCGVCGVPCGAANADGLTCSTGSCDYASCVGSFLDCDGDRSNGCEVDPSSDAAHCGGCGQDCVGAMNVDQALCVGGGCDYGQCQVLFGDCDGTRNNGCERSTNTLTDCGQCDVPCAPDNVVDFDCASGACQHAGCVGPPFDDCDGEPANGCEANTDTDAAHCGGCNSPCGGGSQCLGGQCGCLPTGLRANFDTLSQDTASGCWSGSVCNHDAYNFSSGLAQNFQNFGEAVTCSGPGACVGNVAVTTYQSSATVCQGIWDVLCDGVLVGSIDTNTNGPCFGSAMAGACSVSFPPRICANIQLVAASDNNTATGCCGGTNPDSMLSAFSAW